MTAGERAVAAATAAVGARFRVHGRDPASGLDCVGLAALAARAGGIEGAVPSGYALRGGDVAAIAAVIEAIGLRRVDGQAAAGDLVLFAAGPGQVHFAVQADNGIIHADATLRRVVARPGTPPWPEIGRWRLPDPGPNQE